MTFQNKFWTLHPHCFPWFELSAAFLLYVSSVSIQRVRLHLQAPTVGLTINKHGMAHTTLVC